MIFDSNLASGNLTSQSSGWNLFELDRRFNRLEVEAVEKVYDNNGFYKGEKKNSISLFRYEDKSFLVEGIKEPAMDCMETNVENLLVVNCKGDIHARKLKDGDLPKLI